MWLLLSLAVLVLVNACKDDEDCNLNGVCLNGKCRCDPGWTKETCSWLKLKPAKLTSGYRNSTGASWGGGMFKG